MRKASLAALLVSVALSLGACSKGASEESAGRPSPAASASASHAGHSAAAPNAVEIKLIQFKPESIEVNSGTEITWTQGDAGVHTVTSGTVADAPGGVTTQPDGKFDSGEIATGKTYAHTFDEPGTFVYFCKIHPATIRGEVRVQG